MVGAAMLGLVTSGFAGLIPGGGTTKSDCYAELDVPGITNPSDRVQKNKVVLCTDGEVCDTGGCGDNQCDVRVALCINQTDPTLVDCTPPASLQRAKVTRKGKVKLNVGIPSTLTGPQCTQPVAATIPVKLNKKQRPTGPGKAKVNITAQAPKGTKPRTDGDEVTIKCFPRTVACPPSTTTTLIATTTTTTSTTLVPGCFVDTGDGTIRDTCTGLQWEKKETEVGSGPNPSNLHDVDNRYPWAGCCSGDCSTLANFCQPDAAAAATCVAHADDGTQGCSTCTSGTCNVDPYGTGAITTVWDWLNQLNAGAGFAGHTDWRLPSEAACNSCYSGYPNYTCSACNPHELETILLSPYQCGTSPCIDPIFGPTVGSVYWSASTHATFPNTAWVVNFGNGNAGNDFKDSAGDYVRAVRGGS